MHCRIASQFLARSAVRNAFASDSLAVSIIGPCFRQITSSSSGAFANAKTTAQQRDRAGYLTATYQISARRACRLLKINKSTYYYKSTQSDLNVALAARIKEIATVRVRYGYSRIHVLLRREGFEVNRKRVYRLYSLQGLNLRS